MVDIAGPHDLTEAKQLMRNLGIRAGIGNALIVREAQRRGLDIGATRNGRVRLSRPSVGRTVFTWRNGVSNINSRLARRIIPQKEVTSRILSAAGIRTGENAVFKPGEVHRAWAWAQHLLPVVIKPFNASQGKGVHVGVESWTRFAEAFSAVESEYGEVLVEGLIKGTEHRALVVDDRLIAATRRVPANVTGDGHSSIHELIDEKNRSRSGIHKPIRLDSLIIRNLDDSGLTLDSVPRDGETIFLRRTSNLHTGGDAVDVTDEFSTEERDFVERASRAIPDLRVAGFDILLPRAEGDDPPTVLEVNPFPMISMHHYPLQGSPRDAAGAIVRAMFPH